MNLLITLVAIGYVLATTFAVLYFTTDDKLADCERALARAKARAADDLAHARHTIVTLAEKGERDRDRAAHTLCRVIRHGDRGRG